MQKTGFLFLFSCIAGTPTLAFADATQNWDYSARLRYAEVDNGNIGKDFSQLVRGDWRSQWSDIISSKVEVDYINTALPNEHSDGVHLNGKPLIPDAPDLDVNQAWLTVQLDDTKTTLGRQRLNIDSQRFIGGNGFWQNEQTFDAINSNLKIASNSSFNYTYIANANRIFGNRAHREDMSKSPYDANQMVRPVELYGVHHHNTHLTHLEWNEWDYLQWVVYGYFIDNKDLPSDSNNTFGSSYTFTMKTDALKYRLQIEGALQQRPKTLNTEQTPYYLLDGAIGFNTLEMGSRYEVLGEKNNIAFITPLGSVADFTGWANKFGSTPATGIKDASVHLLWRQSPFRIEAHYHVFNTYNDNKRLGAETDIDILFKPIKKHSLSLRTANFIPSKSSSEKHNTQKLFIDYTYNM